MIRRPPGSQLSPYPSLFRSLPGKHHLYTLGSDVVWFTVANNGTIGYAPALEGALTGHGTPALNVNARAVTVDSRFLDVSSLTMDYVSHTAAERFTGRLLPGP